MSRFAKINVVSDFDGRTLALITRLERVMTIARVSLRESERLLAENSALFEQTVHALSGLAAQGRRFCDSVDDAASTR